MQSLCAYDRKIRQMYASSNLISVDNENLTQLKDFPWGSTIPSLTHKQGTSPLPLEKLTAKREKKIYRDFLPPYIRSLLSLTNCGEHPIAVGCRSHTPRFICHTLFTPPCIL